MNQSIYNIALDLHHAAAPHVLPVKQGDTARELRVTLVEDGSPYEITDDCSAVLCAVLPDGSSATYNMAVENNEAAALIPSAWTVTAGEVECEVELIDDRSGKTIRSPRFSLVIAESLAGSMYAVFWDKAPGSPILRRSQRKYVGDANFDVEIGGNAPTETTYLWLMIPEEIAPEHGLRILTPAGFGFTDMGVSSMTPPEGGSVSLRIFKSTVAVLGAVTVAVRKKQGV